MKIILFENKTNAIIFKYRETTDNDYDKHNLIDCESMLLNKFSFVIIDKISNTYSTINLLEFQGG